MLLLGSESLTAQDIHALRILNDETHRPLPGVTVKILFANKSGRTGRSVSSEASTVAIVTPAEGPSFGIAPAGT